MGVWLDTGPLVRAYLYTSEDDPQTWLLLAREDDFSAVPPPDMAQFGTPRLTGMLALRQRENYIAMSADEAMANLASQGYHFRRFGN
ncbi:MAG: YcgL domain-containing protein [Deltaproteobacteria bacterium]|nr:YcgL domain-containing protein [Deltaproteobacteria bacterium]